MICIPRFSQPASRIHVLRSLILPSVIQLGLHASQIQAIHHLQIERSPIAHALAEGSGVLRQRSGFLFRQVIQVGIEIDCAGLAEPSPPRFVAERVGNQVLLALDG